MSVWVFFSNVCLLARFRNNMHWVPTLAIGAFRTLGGSKSSECSKIPSVWVVMAWCPTIFMPRNGEVAIDVTFCLNGDVADVFVACLMGEDAFDGLCCFTGEDATFLVFNFFGDVAAFCNFGFIGEHAEDLVPDLIGDDAVECTLCFIGDDAVECTLCFIGDDAVECTRLQIGEDALDAVSLLIGEEPMLSTLILIGEEDTDRTLCGIGDVPLEYKLLICAPALCLIGEVAVDSIGIFIGDCAVETWFTSMGEVALEAAGTVIVEGDDGLALFPLREGVAGSYRNGTGEDKDERNFGSTKGISCTFLSCTGVEFSRCCGVAPMEEFRRMIFGTCWAFSCWAMSSVIASSTKLCKNVPVLTFSPKLSSATFPGASTLPWPGGVW